MRTNLEPAYILHRRPFRDTSLLLNVFSKNYGHIMLLARGARNQRSPFYNVIASFTPLFISWAGKTDLPCISKVEPNNSLEIKEHDTQKIFCAYNFSGKAILQGLYLNEIMVRILERSNPYPDLYDAYQTTLLALSENANNDLALRLFEKKLLAEIGYGLKLDVDMDGAVVKEEYSYHFTFGLGVKKTASYPFINEDIFCDEKRYKSSISNEQNIFSGKSLLALHHSRLSCDSEIKDAERLLKLSIQNLLGARFLKSSELL